MSRLMCLPVDNPDGRPSILQSGLEKATPLPSITINTSEAIYIALLNGGEKCQTQFWWAHLDPYAKEFLQQTVPVLKAFTLPALPSPPGRQLVFEDWKELLDEEWRRAVQKQFRDSVGESGGDGSAQDPALAVMHDVHLGCFWAVSHLALERDSLVAKASDLLSQAAPAVKDILPQSSIEMTEFPSAELVKAGVTTHRFEVAARAFNAIQSKIQQQRQNWTRKGFYEYTVISVDEHTKTSQSDKGSKDKQETQSAEASTTDRDRDGDGPAESMEKPFSELRH